MKLRLSIIALTALGAVALGAGPASAMPTGLSSGNGISSNVQHVRLVAMLMDVATGQRRVAIMAVVPL